MPTNELAGPREQPMHSVWEAAFLMAELGYWVFPLSDRGKLPRRIRLKDSMDILPEAVRLKLVDGRGRGGFYAAQRDLKVIEMWAEEIPDANYGVVCGEKCGVTVVDLDRHGPEQDGVAVAQRWKGEGELNCGFYVHTPSNGLHLYYRAFPGKSRTIVSGVELQNLGRYVVGPGCRTRKGAYVGVGTPDCVGAAPDWLIRVVGSAAGSGGSGCSEKLSLLTCVAQWGYVPEGFRHDAVFMEAVILISDGWDEESAFFELRRLVDQYVIGGTSFPDDEIRRNVRNVVRNGTR